MTRLILIRHGETDYNSQNRYCGFSDPPLNNKGIWQSKKLAGRLKGLRTDKIYSSDLKRAYRTAELIFKNDPIERAADFREINFGLFEGLKHEDLVKKYPKVYGDWIDNPIKVKIPDGEGLKDLIQRVMGRLSFIISQHEGKTLAVVTHGGPIRVVLCNALGSEWSRRIDLRLFRQIEQEAGALNIIDYAKGSPPAVVKMNDVSHLFTK